MPERPSLTIYRPVLNLGDEHMQRLVTRAFEMGIPTRRIDAFNSLRACILGHSDLLAFTEQLEVSPTDKEVEELGDFILDSLPVSADQNIIIATLPLYDFRVSGQNAATLFTLGRNNPVTVAERRAAQSAISEFHGSNQIRDWPEDERAVYVRLARIRNLANASTFRQLLEQELETFLPATLKLGPVVVEDAFAR